MSNLALVLISAGCLVAAATLFVAALRTKPESASARYLVQVAEQAGRTQPSRSNEVDGSFFSRVVEPLIAVFTRLGWKLTPAERLRQLEDRLEAAGYPAGWDVNRIVLLKALGLFAGVATGLALAIAFNLGFGLLIMVAAGALGLYLPDLMLRSIATKRTDEMRRQLADTVDILNLTLEAGISFDAALRLVGQYTKGPLAAEFTRVVQEISIGKTRSEALHSLADRTKDEDVRRFCLTCVQAERRGTPLGEILRIQANELRIKRRQLAEEKAQKVPVKILFPLMVFVLPVLLLVIMGPPIYSIVENGLGG